ncbi:hypothetical protein IPL85_01260 [Candidatus Saccharibacteria bacterium]|nr:MAG: hypothetical protein IPL85_01260 [Candidatus Saccharibacteria bacterium]
MINLLPPQIKQAYRFGRINRHLTRWITALALGIVGAVLITAVGYMYLSQETTNYKKQVATTQSRLAEQNFTGLQEEVRNISNNLNLVVDVLSKQILFSELLTQIATLLPSETNLSALSISQVQGAIDITAAAKTYEAAAQIQVNLADPKNGVFSKADIISINCSGTTGYPCTVSIRALFASNSSYMLINDAKKGASGE